MTEQPKRSRRTTLAIAGGALSVLWLFPCAVILAAIWGMVVPFRGFVPAGWEAVTYAPGTVLFIGIVAAGFPITFGLGAAAALIAHRVLRAERTSWGTLVLVSLAVAAVLAGLLVAIGRMAT